MAGLLGFRRNLIRRAEAALPKGPVNDKRPLLHSGRLHLNQALIISRGFHHVSAAGLACHRTGTFFDPEVLNQVFQFLGQGQQFLTSVLSAGRPCRGLPRGAIDA